MYKYTQFDAILNFIPKSVKADEDALQLKSYAAQAYKMFKLPFQQDLKTVLIEVKDHKAFLPNDVLKIWTVFYTEDIISDAVNTLLQDYGDSRLVVYQEIFFSSTHFRSMRQLHYKGQNRQLLIDESLYCNSCKIGWSVDKNLSCLTIDLPDGEIALIYASPVRDESDNMLIPDDPKLLEGLAQYALSKYWLNKAYEGNDQARLAKQFADDAAFKAESLLSNFRGEHLLRSIDIEKHRQLIFGRNKINYSYDRNWRQYR